MYDKKQLRDACWLYAVTDPDCIEDRDIVSCVKDAIAGGATFIQLRDKGASTEELVAQAKRLMPVCQEARVPLVIDDDVEAARLAGVDGVHVGQSDEDCASARKILGSDAIIGVSAQTVEQAIAAQNAGADYLGVGAVAITPTKPEAWVLSPKEITDIVHSVDIPVVAIGGVNAGNASEVMSYEVAGISVVSAVFAAKDILSATQKLSLAIADQQ
jgi:thiamine-phosphate pyrophosphorylase